MTTAPCHINSLPDEILEYILYLIPPYKDLTECSVVCKRWSHAVKRVIEHKQAYFHRSVAYGSVQWSSSSPFGETAKIAKRHSHSACVNGNAMYVFGGCTKTSTAFNDLWKFDLDTRQWERPMPSGNYPSPKAYASMVYYKQSFILYGGWASPSSFTLYQRRKFFDELHVYSIPMNKWIAIQSLGGPPPYSAHSASIHGNTMVVFGGITDFFKGSNDVWCLNLDTYTWHKQPTTDPKPYPRYGQSQIVLDEKNLMIIGGCIHFNISINDAWILNLEGYKWKWTKVKLNGNECAPTKLMYNQACKVGDHLVVLSNKWQLNQTNIINKVDEEESAPIFAVMAYWRGQQRNNVKRSTKRLAIFILNIRKVLSDEHTANWIPYRGIESAGPDERILYSLTLGRGELILFGGMHDLTDPGKPEPEIPDVYNDVHFLKAPKYII